MGWLEAKVCWCCACWAHRGSPIFSAARYSERTPETHLSGFLYVRGTAAMLGPAPLGPAREPLDCARGCSDTRSSPRTIADGECVGTPLPSLGTLPLSISAQRVER